MQPNRNERRREKRKAASDLLRAIVSGKAEVYAAYRSLYAIWCSHNSAVQELRPMFRIPGIEPDGPLSVTAEFETRVRALAAQIVPTLD